ncbi:MAG TPA: cytochrome c3 family protein [Casimicrobiaceae bacterium]|nr:cytochrome c3 family protein [Casimicrobiaceae bacterium]
MAQVFRPRFDLAFRLASWGLVAAVVGGLVAWHQWIRPAVGAPVEQPVPFSHKHHVGDDGIDCRYCHTSVETSAFAGIPPTTTCMTCHSQIFNDAPMLAPVRESLRTGAPLRWNRVYDLPDFAYFNHSIHIAKGIGCVTCHGRVDEMPLMWRNEALEMQWCLGCHRDPDPYLRPRDRVFDMDWQPASATLGATLHRAYHIRSSNQLTNCSICHR